MRWTIALLALATLTPLSAQVGPCVAAHDNLVFDDGSSMGGPNLLIGFRQRSGSTPLTIHGAQFFTGERTGTNTIGIWSHDALRDQPLADLGTGSFAMSTVNSWQGTNLPSPVTVPANTDFWLVWGPINGAQASIEDRWLSSPTVYRGSFDGGRTWNGPYTGKSWKFRVWCHPLGPPAVNTFGLGCIGSTGSTPQIGATGLPRLGQSLTLTLDGALPRAQTWLCLGFSDTLWAGAIPLPHELLAQGAPGCFVLVDLMVVSAVRADGRGSASLAISMPTHPALVGYGFYAQWLAADASANGLGLVTSDAAVVTLGT
ncbi:MAG: hypothetical protein IPM29_02275 [Planctomycetes bacterium]|nr:hypothetical protein [Planctomycetota bacterium]